MNETVKADLLDSRIWTRRALEAAQSDVEVARRQLSRAEAKVTKERRRLADIEAHLRENGVDLAAVDAVPREPDNPWAPASSKRAPVSAVYA